MQRQITTYVSSCAALAVAAISLASCAPSSPPSAGQSSSGRPTSAPPATSQPASPSTSPALRIACTDGWRTGSVTVTRQVAVPPVPVAQAVRTGSHPDCKFDRLVIDISGPVPGYSVSFVQKVTQDASGKTITMPGTSYLVIRLSPAAAHTAAGHLTLPAGVQAVNDPMLKAWTTSGDFEGVLHVALGLAGGSKYRVDKVGSRIYLDVAW
jgi:hypothetical protein